MTKKQIEFLEHLHMYGDGNLETFSGQVMHTCCRKGWIEVDEDAPFPYGETAADTAWILTDAGRLALHEATR